MDYSSLSESQQQLLAQYQQYQQQQQQQQQQQDQTQQQQQQQQPPQQQQAYDPSQAQAYDPNASYYSYPQTYQYPPQQPQPQPQPQPYAYYDYSSNPYQDPNLQAQAPPPDPSQMIAAAPPGSYAPAQDQQSAYAPAQDQQAAYAPAPDQQGSYPTHSGLNPAAAAAVAALSQLTQFAGTMDAAERAMQERQWHEKGGGFGHQHQHQHQQPPPPHMMQHGPYPGHHNAGRPPFRGGGRRGGGPHRGGGRSGHRPPRQDGGGRPFRGRGRMGRGGGRRFTPHPAAATSAPPYPYPYPEPGPFMGQPPASFPGPASKPAKVARQPPQVLWCEICRVECNSLEILERHNSGKRHKKTLQRYEEIQKHKKLESQSQAMVTNQAENVQGDEEIKAATDNGPHKDSAPADVLAGASTDVNKAEPDLQNQVAEQSEMAKVDTNEAPMRKRQMDRFDNQRHPAKRGKTTKFGRGGKRPRPSEPVRRSESPKEQPTRYCALCNIMCDTQAVFECHLQGKKHQSRAQRFPVPQVGYVAMGYHAPSTRNAQPADSKPQGPPEEGSGNHQAQQAVSGTQAQEHSDPQGQEVIPKSEGKGDVMIKHEGGDTVIAEHKGQDVVLETVDTQDNSGAATEHADNVYMPVEDILPAPEFGVPLADNILMPGLDVKSEGDGSINEEPTSHE